MGATIAAVLGAWQKRLFPSPLASPSRSSSAALELLMTAGNVLLLPATAANAGLRGTAGPAVAARTLLLAAACAH